MSRHPEHPPYRRWPPAGAVFGRPSRYAVTAELPGFRLERDIDFDITSGENAADGAGITS